MSNYDANPDWPPRHDVCIHCGGAPEHAPGCRWARAQEPTGRPMSPAGIAEQREREIATRNPVTSDDLAGQAKKPRTFTCIGCKREMPWGKGAADDMPEHCDDCWVEAHDGEPALPVAPRAAPFRPPTVTVERDALDEVLRDLRRIGDEGVLESSHHTVEAVGAVRREVDGVADRLERLMQEAGRG